MISAVILTHNEEKNIAACIDSLSWVDEIVVIDDNSQDKTKIIAQKKGAQIFSRKLEGDFSSQRNYGLSKTYGDWILFIDADERVSEKLAQEIKEKELQTKSNINGYFFKRHDNIFGKTLKHGEIGGVRLLRLGRKNSGKWKRRVHEVWKVKGITETLNNPIVHFPHPSLYEFITDIDHYSSLDAQEKNEAGIKSSLLKIIFYPIYKFIVNFFFKLGFLDGGVGFVVTLLMSFHSYLSWSKLWLLGKNK